MFAPAVRGTAFTALLLAAGATPGLAQDSAPAHPPLHQNHASSAAPAAGHGMHHTSGWAELDEFHMVMMATWHPARQKNDLAPIRARAGDLAAAAEKWASSTAPAKCADTETKKTVAKVAADSRELAALVARKGSEDDVKAALAALHDTFETVEHGCAGGH